MGTQSSAAQTSDRVLGKVELNVQRVLKPVAAPSAFRERLHDGLVMAAQHQQTHQALEYSPAQTHSPPWIWFVGAVAMGAGLGFSAIRRRAR